METLSLLGRYRYRLILYYNSLISLLKCERHFELPFQPLLSAHGALNVASYYSNHMVLQRGPQQAVLWGTADTEGDTVTAQVTGQGSAVTATVQSGVWKLKLPAVTAPGPFDIDVRSGDGHVKLHDVLFGDVWFCSGQSNMELSMNQASAQFEILPFRPKPKRRRLRVRHCWMLVNNHGNNQSMLIIYGAHLYM